MRLLIMGAGSEVGFALARALARVYPDGEYFLGDEVRTTSASQRMSTLGHLGQVLELPWTASKLAEGILAGVDQAIVVPPARDAPEAVHAALAFAYTALSSSRPVILWSDSLVYGWCHVLPTEEHPLHPPNESAAALATIEVGVLHLARLHKVPAWALRAPWLYGPALRDPREVIGGDPLDPMLVELLHIEDAARYLLRLLEMELPSGIYNLGPGELIADAALHGRAHRLGAFPRHALRATDSTKLQQALDPLPPRRHCIADILP